MSSFSEAVRDARVHMEKTLLERAASDPAFRALLKSNPHAAIREQFGSDPVPSLKITVLEEEAGEAVLVLPRKVAEDELSDDLLDLASGGIGFSAFLPVDWWNMKTGTGCKK